MPVYDRITLTGNSDRGHLELKPMAEPSSDNPGGLYLSSDGSLRVHDGSDWREIADARNLGVSGGDARNAIGEILSEREVCPLDFGGRADGESNDYNAIMDAIAALGSRGGRLNLAGRKWYSAFPIQIDVPIVIDGGTGGYGTGTNSALGGEIIFAAGITGIEITNSSRMSAITRLAVTSLSTTSGTDDGIVVKGGRWRIEQVYVRKFGRHGVSIAGDSSDGSNANLGVMDGVRLVENRGDGLHIEGTDSNACSFYGVDCSGNDGWGIYNDSAKNGFYSCHGNANDLGDYYDGGPSSLWLNPYAEAGGTFVIGSDSYNGILLSGGGYAPPTIWSGSPSVLGATAAVAAGWTILDQNVWKGNIRVASAASTHEWRLAVGQLSADQLAIRDQTTAQNFVNFKGDAGDPRVTVLQPLHISDGTNVVLASTTGTKLGTASTQKLGFWGATPVVRPTVTGTTDTEKLESLLTALAAAGLITDSTT